jgi:hypothetical protein
MSATYYRTGATPMVAPGCCPECATKWMRQLWVGHCICTGHVLPSLPVPGGKLERHRFTVQRKVVENVDQYSEVKKELHIAPDKKIRKGLKSDIEKYKAAMAQKTKL